MKSHHIWLSLLLIVCLPLQALALQMLPCVHMQQQTEMNVMSHCHQIQVDVETNNNTPDTCQNCTVCHLSSPYSPLLSYHTPSPQYKTEQNPAPTHYFYSHATTPPLRPPQSL